MNSSPTELTSPLLEGEDLVFVRVEGTALCWALISDLLLARRRIPGSAAMALGLLLSIVAGVLQASSLHISLIWPLDHNGLYHLGQLAGVMALQAGLRDLLRTPTH
ncbi:MAG: hypothetical protein ABJC19_02110 [Gemmatimonadota bacterium]